MTSSVVSTGLVWFEISAYWASVGPIRLGSSQVEMLADEQRQLNGSERDASWLAQMWHWCSYNRSTRTPGRKLADDLVPGCIGS
jgi:hypothetical protein